MPNLLVFVMLLCLLLQVQVFLSFPLSHVCVCVVFVVVVLFYTIQCCVVNKTTATTIRTTRTTAAATTTKVCQYTSIPRFYYRGTELAEFSLKVVDICISSPFIYETPKTYMHTGSRWIIYNVYTVANLLTFYQYAATHIGQ